PGPGRKPIPKGRRALVRETTLPALPRAAGARRSALTSSRLSAGLRPVSSARRATIYSKPELHRALRLKAAATDRSVSDMVNDAVKLALAEDAEDLEAFRARRGEPTVDFETFVKALKRRGEL
ncbi:MAG: hypothetical protein ACREID_01025, partial [Planctomycetota bacterium]